LINMKIEKYPIQNIINKKWYVQGFNSCLNYIFHGPQSGLIGCHKFLGYGYTEMLFIFKKDYLEYHYLENDWKNIGQEFLKRFEKDRSYLRQIMKKDRNLVARAEKTMRKIEKINFNFLNKKQLVDLYQEIWDNYHLTVDVSHVIEGISFVVEPLLKEKLEKIFGLEKHESKFRELFNALFQPAKPSFANDEYIEILGIIQLIERDKKSLALFKNQRPVEILRKMNPTIRKRLIAHAKKYFYNQVNYFYGESLNELDYIKEIKDLFKEGVDARKKIVEEKNKYILNNRKRQEIIKKYKINGEVAKLIEISLQVLHWQDYRKKNILSGVYFMNLILKEIGKRFEIPLEMLKRYAPPEIAMKNLNQFNRAEAKERIKQFVVYMRREKNDILISFYLGKNCDNFMGAYRQKFVEKNDVHGTCAAPGKMLGMVKVCKTKEDLARFKKGEVLVAAMTRPEYVPAMRKAAAIVTNEGGLTCHAAIVARELGIPCVIGTKIATEVLKNGDLVEVNANHGTVRKVKK
jgi:phosphohistidine swiveling domain-containing protein